MSPSKNSAHRKITESLLGIAGGGSCPGLSNRCIFDWPTNRLGNTFLLLSQSLLGFGLCPQERSCGTSSQQVNDSDIAAQITVFYLRRDNRRRFTPFLVYALIYPIIAIHLMTLATLSPWQDSVCTHTCYPLLRKPILRGHRTFKTVLLINWQLVLNSFGSQQPHQMWTKELVKHV